MGRQYQLFLINIKTGDYRQITTDTISTKADPIFLPDGFVKTLAEMNLTEKNKISHLARAIGNLVVFLKSQNT